MKRRTFLLGTITGLSAVVLASCTPENPPPTPTRSPRPPVAPAVPRPAAFTRSSWSTDPFARGSFSFQPVGSTPEQRVALAQPVDNRIFFAGEHTDDLNPGTVQGAIASGERAAAEVRNAGRPGERIAVVGAGIAGATAARELSDAGFSVVVIEGRERVGGRLHTIDNDNWPLPVDLGAAWVYDASRNTVAAQLAAIDVDADTFDFRYEQRTPAGAIVEPTTVGPDAVTAALAWAVPQPADVSLLKALDGSGAAKLSTDADESGVSDAGRLASYLATDVVADSGADTGVLSSWYAGDPTRSPEDDRYVVGGYQKLVSTRLDGLDMLTTSAVSNVTSSERGVSLRLSRGESISVDRAVITVPLGVLQSNSIEFTPPLPFAHRGAISALSMGTQDKVILRFRRPFWSTDATVWTVIADDVTEFTQAPTPTPSPDPRETTAPLLQLWYNLEPLTGEPILVGIVGGEAALRMAELSDDEVLAAALASLEPFLDPEVLETPAPTDSPTPTPTESP
jgi:hypothetical protein